MKELFYDPTSYKWKIKKFDEFINDKNLNAKICIEILELVCDYPFYILHPGRIGFIKFINKLKEKDRRKQVSNQRIRRSI